MLPEVELLSFLEIARRELSHDLSNTAQLPASIRDALNTIFTKKANAKFYRAKLINEKVTDQKQNKHPIIKGCKDSVHNILIIWYLFNSDTKKTKELLQEYAQGGISANIINVLTDLTKQQYLEFFCLGVVRENIEEIIECLQEPDFDLFTSKLPSPFSTGNKPNFDISPMLKIYSKEIPWEYYMSEYQTAERFFEDKKFVKAKATLSKLEATAYIRLPVIESLNKKIDAAEVEAKEAWDYFQNILI